MLAFCSIFRDLQYRIIQTNFCTAPISKIQFQNSNRQKLEKRLSKICKILKIKVARRMQILQISKNAAKCVFARYRSCRYRGERALQSSLIFFNFHTAQGFNFHIATPPGLSPYRHRQTLIRYRERRPRQLKSDSTCMGMCKVRILMTKR